MRCSNWGTTNHPLVYLSHLCPAKLLWHQQSPASVGHLHPEHLPGVPRLRLKVPVWNIAAHTTCFILGHLWKKSCTWLIYAGFLCKCVNILWWNHWTNTLFSRSEQCLSICDMKPATYAFERSWNVDRLNRSAREVKCQVHWPDLRILHYNIYIYIYIYIYNNNNTVFL